MKIGVMLCRRIDTGKAPSVRERCIVKDSALLRWPDYLYFLYGKMRSADVKMDIVDSSLLEDARAVGDLDIDCDTNLRATQHC